MTTPTPVLILDDGSARVATLAASVHLPLISADDRAIHDAIDDAIVLAFDDDTLEARRPGDRPGTGVRVDLRTLDVRPGSPNLSKKQPLARAVGGTGRVILDATAGLGADAALLAALGHTVIAVERHPVVAALLADGVRRAMDDPRLGPILRDRLTVRHADARDVLDEITPDVVYLDPMFPPKRKTSALPRKEIVLLRTLVGDDPDAAALLAHARDAPGVSRVIVKRADDAPTLAPDPAGSHAGRTVRYDVYVRS